MNCTRNCLYQGNGECGLKLTSSDATSRCPLVPEDSPANAPFKHQPTRADYIRSMPDEELAEWMSVFMRDILSTNDMDDDFEVDPSFAEDMLRWLKQPYGGNGK